MSFANITVVGNLGQMPEFRQVSGKEVCNFSLAVNRKVKGDKTTTWFNVVSWDERKNAIIKDYVRKGHQLMVVGELRPRQFTDKQGLDKTSLDVDISFNGSLVLLNNTETGNDAPAERGRDTRSSGQSQKSEPSYTDDDIPF